MHQSSFHTDPKQKETQPPHKTPRKENTPKYVRKAPKALCSFVTVTRSPRGGAIWVTSPTGFILLLKPLSKCTARSAVVPLFWSPTALLIGSLAASNSGAAGRRILVLSMVVERRQVCCGIESGFLYILYHSFCPSIGRVSAQHAIRVWEGLGEVFTSAIKKALH
jgi:hypothetical protein